MTAINIIALIVVALAIFAAGFAFGIYVTAKMLSDGKVKGVRVVRTEL